LYLLLLLLLLLLAPNLWYKYMLDVQIGQY
jgi:hypothetical protein